MTAQTVPEEAEMAEISSLVTSEVHGIPVKAISRSSKMLVPFAQIIGAFQMLRKLQPTQMISRKLFSSCKTSVCLGPADGKLRLLRLSE